MICTFVLALGSFSLHFGFLAALCFVKLTKWYMYMSLCWKKDTMHVGKDSLKGAKERHEWKQIVCKSYPKWPWTLISYSFLVRFTRWQGAAQMWGEQSDFLWIQGSKFNLTSFPLSLKAYQSAEVLEERMVEI